MTAVQVVVVLIIGATIASVGFWCWNFTLRKPKQKKSAVWMTRHQLEVLTSINATGSAGIKLWYTDINMGTIRSLCKRGFADTAPGGRIVTTRSGKRRLAQPWPAEAPTGDQKARVASDDTGEADSDGPAAAHAG